MITLNWTKESLDSVERELPAGEPIYMLNLLRFRSQADASRAEDVSGMTGQAVFTGKYAPAFAEVCKNLGIDSKPTWIGVVAGAVVGPAQERWDMIAIVEYPSFEDFRKVVESPEYEAKASQYRLAATEDLRLIASTKMELPA